jgi:hypothetical protein
MVEASSQPRGEGHGVALHGPDQPAWPGILLTLGMADSTQHLWLMVFLSSVLLWTPVQMELIFFLSSLHGPNDACHLPCCLYSTPFYSLIPLPFPSPLRQLLLSIKVNFCQGASDSCL